MEFNNFIHSYLNVFCILGQSPCLTKNRASNNKFCQTSIFFTVAHAIFGIGLAVSCIELLNFHGNDRWDITEKVMINFVVICDIIRIIFVFLQCIIYRDTVAHIIGALRRLTTEYVIHLQHHITFGKFSRSYSRKVVIIFGFFVPDLAIIVWMSIIGNLGPIIIQIKLLQMMRATNILHIILYVDMLNFYLSELNEVAERDLKDRQAIMGASLLNRIEANEFYVTRRLKYYKHAHFQLWEAAQRINSYLGWSMMAIFQQNFVDFVYASFWLLKQLQQPWQAMQVFGMLNH